MVKRAQTGALEGCVLLIAATLLLYGMYAALGLLGFAIIDGVAWLLG